MSKWIFLMLLVLAGCANNQPPATAVTNPEPLTEGRRFTGNVETDGSCTGGRCNAAIELSFDGGKVSIRRLSDTYIKPGDLMLVRGATFVGVFPYTVPEGAIVFRDGPDRTYKVWHDGSCLTGKMDNTRVNMRFDIKVCPTH